MPQPSVVAHDSCSIEVRLWPAPLRLQSSRSQSWSNSCIWITCPTSCVTFEPLPPGSGFTFENDVVGGTVPKEYIPGVEKGVKGSLDNGVLAGFPVIDLKVTLTDGAYHEVDSSALAFEIASRAAMKEGLAKAAPKLLEPIMKVEVVTPRDYMGDVIGDLNSRRGRITGQDQRGNAEVINAMVPLANMFGYVNNLRSMSQGRAQYTMHFDHYEQVPQAVADEVRVKMA